LESLRVEQGYNEVDNEAGRYTQADQLKGGHDLLPSRSQSLSRPQVARQRRTVTRRTIRVTARLRDLLVGRTLGVRV